MTSHVQRKRTKGCTNPSGAVYAGRGSRWGNPYAMRRNLPPVWLMSVTGVHSSYLTHRRAAEAAVSAYRDWLNTNPEHVEEARRQLSGRDLMCWCAQEDPCHGDVLLALANGSER